MALRIRLWNPINAALAAGALLLSVLVAPSAAAAPAPSVTPLASVHLPSGAYNLADGQGAVWAITVDEAVYSSIYRIDATANQVTARLRLGYPAAGLVVADGSLWVSDYYGSRLNRYSLDGELQASIRVGLQPQYLLFAFGSVWTSNHHAHSLSRIDPATNQVIATVDVGARAFRNGPQEMVASSRYLYVGSSNITYLQRVDPATDRVTNLGDTGRLCCGDLQYAPGRLGGTIWDLARSGLAARDVLGGTRLRIPADNGDQLTTCTDLDGQLWYGENGPGRAARLRSVDDYSGARGADIPFSGHAGFVLAAFGSLWNLPGTGLLQRFDPGAGSIG